MVKENESSTDWPKTTKSLVKMKQLHAERKKLVGT